MQNTVKYSLLVGALALSACGGSSTSSSPDDTGAGPSNSPKPSSSPEPNPESSALPSSVPSPIPSTIPSGRPSPQPSPTSSVPPLITNYTINVEAELFALVGGDFDDGNDEPIGTYSTGDQGAINYVNTGDYAEYELYNNHEAEFTASFNVGTNADENTGIELLIENNGSWNSLGQLGPINASGWDNFQAHELTNGFDLPAGDIRLRVLAIGSSEWQWNLESFSLSTELKPSVLGIEFEDLSFANCVNRHVAVHQYTDITQITALTCNNENIVSLAGIEALSNLQELSLDSNKLEDISLTSNPHLTALVISDNQLSRDSLNYLNDLGQLSYLESDAWLVVTNSDSGASIRPNRSGAADNESIQFQLELESGYVIDSISGCNGSLENLTYRTAPLSADCNINLTTSIDPATLYSGHIRDADTNEPLAGVAIKLLDDALSTTSDAAGFFELRSSSTNSQGFIAEHPDYMFKEIDALAPSDNHELNLRRRVKSAATLRWEGYISNNSPTLDYTNQSEWTVSFSQQALTGDLAADRDVTRRDPSAVIYVDGLYYTWYSHCVGDVVGFDSGDPEGKVFPWDKCDLYYSSSADGYHWQEQGPAIERGPAGSYDDRSIFTPEILYHEDRFYLVYQAVKAPYVRRVKNTVGMSWATSPHGPWTKLDEPILKATNNGEWLGDEDNRFNVVTKGDFDSHKVHDPTLLYFNGKFHLYYKGERMGEEQYFGQREIKWGVAISDDPLGPYVKSTSNPITNTGHELVIWKYDEGIALINTLDGPERGTIQFAEDGLNFEIMSTANNLPHAQGLYRSPVSDTDPTAGVSWGLSHVLVWDKPGGWMYINRFDLQ
ncbi:family 43 glycosylhydrolase [Agaribacterium sp. ZY112]|uniref:family 43 glycosylhydrolase n=1 Tax=Agaribacterium sp. ZY112 TaxID=3233574 RepID=UPI003526464D